MNALQSKKQGFTIIEVVLVLAIAALIFLMIFIALPALQRGQRDTARKNDASTVAAALNNYRTQNRTFAGTTPITAARLQSYVDKLDQYDVSSIAISTGNLAPTAEQVVFRTGVKCPATAAAPGATSITPAPGTSRTAAVAVLLENNGSQSLIHCVDV